MVRTRVRIKALGITPRLQGCRCKSRETRKRENWVRLVGYLRMSLLAWLTLTLTMTKDQ